MKESITHMSDSVKHFVDGLSVFTVLGTLVNMLPSIAALFTIVWTAIRIYETDTIQSFLGKKDGENDA